MEVVGGKEAGGPERAVLVAEQLRDQGLCTSPVAKSGTTAATPAGV